MTATAESVDLESVETPEAIDFEQADNPNQVKFTNAGVTELLEWVTDDEIPAPPQTRERDTDRWNAIEVLLKSNPNRWLKAKVYNQGKDPDKKAGLFASNIRANRIKRFPAQEWDARAKANAEAKESYLYLRYNGASSNGDEPDPE